MLRIIPSVAAAVLLGALMLMPATADAQWRYLQLGGPVDFAAPAAPEAAWPELPRAPLRSGAQTLTIGGRSLGQFELLLTSDNEVLLPIEAARAAGLGLGGNRTLPDAPNLFLSLAELHPPMQAVGYEGTVALQPRSTMARRAGSQGVPAQARPARRPDDAYAPRFEHALPWPGELDQAPRPLALHSPEPLAQELDDLREQTTHHAATVAFADLPGREVQVTVDGQPRGITLAALDASGSPKLSLEELRRLRLPVPAVLLRRGYAVPADLAQSFAHQFNPETSMLSLTTLAAPDLGLSADQAIQAADRVQTPTVRPSRSTAAHCGGPRRGVC